MTDYIIEQARKKLTSTIYNNLQNNVQLTQCRQTQITKNSVLFQILVCYRATVLQQQLFDNTLY